MKDIEGIYDYCPSENPGAHERHFIRRNDNVLFGKRSTEVNNALLQEKILLDRSILETFMSDFKTLVSKVAELKSSEESSVILGIKSELDQLYAVSASLGDDQHKVQEPIKVLIGLVMEAVKKGAENNPQALEKINEEESARLAHFSLLESTLVADLLEPESPIRDEDLLATLLSAEKKDLALAIQLFDRDQVSALLTQSKSLLDMLESENNEVSKAIENQAFMEGYLQYLE